MSTQSANQSATQFSSQVFQKPFLLEGETIVNAVMTVSSSGGAAQAISSTELVMGFLVDDSGSMSDGAGSKIRNAREALVTAIQMLRPTDEFFVIAGNSSASVVVELCLATDENKSMAVHRVRSIEAGGGTMMSTWLQKARQIFNSRPNKIHQAVLLTDGANDGSDQSALEREVEACEGVFQCECRGVEAAYEPAQLRLIAGGLLGSVDMVRDASTMATDFEAIMQKSAGLAINNVLAQVWVPLGAKIVAFKQMTPDQLELSGKVIQGPNAQTFLYPTGAWGGEESRDYLVTIELAKAAEPNTPAMLAGRAALIFSEGGTEIKVGEAKILAAWTDDIDEGSRVEPKVDNYTGQADLTKKVQDGLALRRAGNEDEATKALQRAHELAVETGNEGTRRLLEKIVDVENDGTVRLKQIVDEADAVELDTRSTRTKRI